MASGRPDRRVLSIGCSCINRFQFDFFIHRHPGSAALFPRGLFDWNIASLDATLRVLRLATDGSLTQVLDDSTSFHLAWDALILNRDLPGFSFFHEEKPKELLADPERRAAFLGKLRHLSRPFVSPAPNVQTHVFWSNLQPNLPDTVENVIPWDGFVLSQARYDEAKALGRRIFGDATTFSFLSTPQDMDIALADQPDVHVFDLPRGPEYKGDPRLYDALLSGLLHGAD